MVQRLKEAGKHTVGWLSSADTWGLYLASACDQVFVPESAPVFMPGLRAEQLFLKETLAMAGLSADLEVYSEYKTTPDALQRESMSEHHREMLESILDSILEELLASVSSERGLTPHDLRQLMDRMPISATAAREAGLIDSTLYEDEIATSLGSEDNPAALITWRQARKWLRRPVHWRRSPTIGVISVEGTIVLGASRRLPSLPIPLPFLQQQAGSDTIIQTLRAAQKDSRIAAVVLHVNTPGGSALASDLIWREVQRLREQKPLVVLMGDQATSGGYYISTPANAIVAQPFTLTGSIGIWGGKIVTAGLYNLLRIGRGVVERGDRAGLYSDAAPFTEEEREAIRREIGHGYARFKSRVADGRDMTPDQVEAVSRGRVWTGKQACEQGLVDELGDFKTALRRAKELAGLDTERRYPVEDVEFPKGHILPLPLPGAMETLGEIALALRAIGNEHIWALPPLLLKFTATG
jgi:protease-4